MKSYSTCIIALNVLLNSLSFPSHITMHPCFIAYLEFVFVWMCRRRLGIVFTNWSIMGGWNFYSQYCYIFFYKQYNFNESQWHKYFFRAIKINKMIYFAINKNFYRIQTSSLTTLISHDIHVHCIIHILTKGSSLIIFNYHKPKKSYLIFLL